MKISKGLLCSEPIEAICFSDNNKRSSVPLRFAELYDLGLKQQAEGNLNRALWYFKRSIKVNNLSVTANLHLGDIQLELGNFQEAIKQYHRVIVLDPNHHAAHFNLGCIYFQQKSLQAASHYFQAASSLKSDPATWTNLGLVFLEMGDMNLSLEANEKALSIDNKFEVAYYNLGNLYHQLHKYDDAIAMHSMVLKLNSKHMDATFNLGVAYQEKGELNKALEAYRECLKLDNGCLDANNMINDLVTRLLENSSSSLDDPRKSPHDSTLAH
mmetsp:Transcript_18590/g.23937  ORF Transcript_18590/g.23937 Transcript_18590/m.23937 type:complete len:270 (+) Transcript_18590:49-858(+)|eukprot:CAMPEP_0117803866 /NCGR_PEP_ID=MMETSP0948-20121206/16731_1 /TAXON_ID=44440 /ORGANISM="Chattonella subsalsa, Strain CCMP2191" /LENGTH=269 /DNA_ID=CAMNT_0005637239 /DNA_START=147 /DNA_END=959 /DNA_ORIENTATION=-